MTSPGWRARGVRARRRPAPPPSRAPAVEVVRLRGPFPWAEAVAYSQAVRTGGLIFLSGQYASGDDGAVASPEIREQVRITFRNIEQILRELSMSLADLVHLRVYLLDIRDLDAYRTVRSELLPGAYPATTVLAVKAFAVPGMLVELEAVARVPAESEGRTG